MIRRKTVLILGAGASEPFGFVTGSGLTDRILQLTRPPDNRSADSLAYSLFESVGVQFPEVVRFNKEFGLSQKYSIDAFVEHRPEFLKIGKAAIAATLLPMENEERLMSGGDWYKQLFNWMSSPRDEFDQNRLTIVTFNYDRSFEHFFCTALRHAYGLGFEEADKMFRTIRVFHVNGSLGKYEHKKDRAYGCKGRLWPDTTELSAAMSEIRIVHEPMTEPSDFVAIQERIKDADVVGFLGFGFDRINFERIWPSDHPRWTNKFAFLGSSGFDVSLSARRSFWPYNEPKNGFVWGDPSHKVLDFLRHNMTEWLR